MKTNRNDIIEDYIDRMPLAKIGRQDKLKLIRKELRNRKLSHGCLMDEWNEDIMWLWEHCQPAGNEDFCQVWIDLIAQVNSSVLPVSAVEQDVDDVLEEAVMGELVNDGEDAQDGWVSENELDMEEAVDEDTAL